MQLHELVLLREEGCVDLAQPLRHQSQGDVCSVAREAVDRQQVGQVLRPGQGGVIHNSDQMRLAQQPAERLGGAVERRVPCQHLRAGSGRGK
jgi:hypothetical protein